MISQCWWLLARLDGCLGLGVIERSADSLGVWLRHDNVVVEQYVLGQMTGHGNLGIRGSLHFLGAKRRLMAQTQE
jgi:hypothetical protein